MPNKFRSENLDGKNDSKVAQDVYFTISLLKNDSQKKQNKEKQKFYLIFYFEIRMPNKFQSESSDGKNDTKLAQVVYFAIYLLKNNSQKNKTNKISI